VDGCSAAVVCGVVLVMRPQSHTNTAAILSPKSRSEVTQHISDESGCHPRD